MDPLSPASWSLSESAGVFALCALTITVLGIWITRVVDQLADRTGLGEAVAGAVLLGASTSVGGSVLSVAAAWKGHPELAVSNALGGIAVQTLFLVVADLAYWLANLEHAAASVPNMLQNALLITLLGLIILTPHAARCLLVGHSSSHADTAGAVYIWHSSGAGRPAVSHVETLGHARNTRGHAG